MPLAARSALLPALLVAAASLNARAADDGVLLKWKFKPGDSSRFVGSQDMQANTKARGLSQEVAMKQTSDIRWVVDSIDDDGNAHITQTVQRLRVETGPVGDTIKYDSDDDKVPEGADEAQIEAMRIGVNQPLNLVLDPLGKVVDVRLSDQFAKRLKESPHYGQLAMMYSRENLKQMASMITVELPAKPIAKGATWEQQTSVTDPLAGKQKVTTTYRYDGTEEHDGRQLDKISATAKISFNDDNKDENLLPQPSIKDQKMNGVIWFNRKAGRVEETQLTSKVVTEATIGMSKVERTLVIKQSTRLANDADAEPAKKPVAKASDSEDL
ncbi:MAG TPA: DUF6263 family protein [Pirellulales bacterium]|nr:DUF6263 family protein [Pirellulales bacterium]